MFEVSVTSSYIEAAIFITLLSCTFFHAKLCQLWFKTIKCHNSSLSRRLIKRLVLHLPQKWSLKKRGTFINLKIFATLLTKNHITQQEWPLITSAVQKINSTHNSSLVPQEKQSLSPKPSHICSAVSRKKKIDSRVCPDESLSAEFLPVIHVIKSPLSCVTR